MQHPDAQRACSFRYFCFPQSSHIRSQVDCIRVLLSNFEVTAYTERDEASARLRADLVAGALRVGWSRPRPTSRLDSGSGEEAGSIGTSGAAVQVKWCRGEREVVGVSPV